LGFGEEDWSIKLEHPAVISGSDFSRLYTSFWRNLAPTTDLLVRRINLGQHFRDFPEMATTTAPARRGFINEVAFAMFCDSVRKRRRWPFCELTADEISVVSASIKAKAGLLGRGIAGEAEGHPSVEELSDIYEQHNRMMRIFTVDFVADEIVPEPVFPGCGIVDTCTGDLLASTTLFEVKAGDRLFRSVDVRQLVTYATLNYLSKRFNIRRVGLFNPRIGIRLEIDLDELCFEISGKRCTELLPEIMLAISSGEISR
jgi:hypothetical protein